MQLRKCDVRGIGHTGVTVSDMEASIAFYRDTLGLSVSDPLHLSGPVVSRIVGIAGAELDVAYVRAPGHILELMCFIQPKGGARAARLLYDSGFSHICIKVKDLEFVMQAASSAGFVASSPVERLQDGPASGLKVVYVRDPDGVLIELMEEPEGLTFESLFFQNTAAS
jgi:catechol 2,3-dioxygenase-like lactoylglutathione lyase family enzyme